MKIVLGIIDAPLELTKQKSQKIVKDIIEAFKQGNQGIVFSNQALIGALGFLYADFSFIYDYQKDLIFLIQEQIPEDFFVIAGFLNPETKNYEPCLIQKESVILDDLFRIKNGKGKDFLLGVASDIQEFYKRKNHFAKAEFLFLLQETPLSILKKEIVSRTKLLKELEELNQIYPVPIISTNIACVKDEYLWDGFVSINNGPFTKKEEDDLSPLFKEYFAEVILDLKMGAYFINPHKPSYSKSKIEEIIYKAILKSIKSYYKAASFNKGIVAISGGIDSAVVACLAVKALGAENVIGVLMPGPYSSNHSIEDGKALCNNLGIQTEIIVISENYHLLSQNLREKMPLEEGDLSMQNIQARLRGLIAMSFANHYNGLMLNTCNKSEDAVGYSTLYGDAIGGFAPIADLYKKDVYSLGHFINQQEGKELIPTPIFKKAPSAELAEDQKDSDSLPEYDILDNILILFLEDHKSSSEISKKLNVKQQIVDDVIQKIFYSQYKRRQSPPGIYFSPKNKGLNRNFSVSGFKKDTK